MGKTRWQWFIIALLLESTLAEFEDIFYRMISNMKVRRRKFISGDFNTWATFTVLRWRMQEDTVLEAFAQLEVILANDMSCWHKPICRHGASQTNDIGSYFSCLHKPVSNQLYGEARGNKKTHGKNTFKVVMGRFKGEAVEITAHIGLLLEIVRHLLRQEDRRSNSFQRPLDMVIISKVTMKKVLEISSRQGDNKAPAV